MATLMAIPMAGECNLVNLSHGTQAAQQGHRIDIQELSRPVGGSYRSRLDSKGHTPSNHVQGQNGSRRPQEARRGATTIRVGRNGSNVRHYHRQALGRYLARASPAGCASGHLRLRPFGSQSVDHSNAWQPLSQCTHALRHPKAHSGATGGGSCTLNDAAHPRRAWQATCRRRRRGLSSVLSSP